MWFVKCVPQTVFFFFSKFLVPNLSIPSVRRKKKKILLREIFELTQAQCLTQR